MWTRRVAWMCMGCCRCDEEKNLWAADGRRSTPITPDRDQGLEQAAGPAILCAYDVANVAHEVNGSEQDRARPGGSCRCVWTVAVAMRPLADLIEGDVLDGVVAP